MSAVGRIRISISCSGPLASICLMKTPLCLHTQPHTHTRREGPNGKAALAESMLARCKALQESELFRQVRFPVLCFVRFVGWRPSTVTAQGLADKRAQHRAGSCPSLA